MKVKARHLLKTKRGVTDEHGNFKVGGSFKAKPYHFIEWTRPQWSIRSGQIGKAKYKGPKIKSEWHVRIGPDNRRQLGYASIHRALFRHFYTNNLGLRRAEPRGRSLKISYFHEDGTSLGKYWSFSQGGVFPDIRVWGFDGIRQRQTDEIFGTAAHEIAHAAHCLNEGRISFWKKDAVIVESWARCVQKYVIEAEYGQLGLLHLMCETIGVNDIYNSLYPITQQTTVHEKPNKWNLNDYSPLKDKIYTSIFIDLIDDFNQRLYFEITKERTPASNFPNDDIFGFPITELEKILDDISTVKDLKKKVANYKGKYNITDQTLNNFFELYL